MYFAVAGYMAHVKVMETDEFISHCVLIQPTWTRAMEALAHGPDASPPLYHLVTQPIVRVFGDGHLAMRSPAIFGFWLMSVGVFEFLRRAGHGRAAWIALILPSMTGAFMLSIQARPYGLLLGISALVLLAWQHADGKTRATSAIPLWLALSAAWATHWYGTLLVPAVAVAELGRSVQERRIRHWIWVALAGSAAILPVLWPFFQHAREFRGHFVSSPRPVTLYQIYEALLQGSQLFLALCLGSAIWLSGESSWRRPDREVWIASGFVLIPVFGYLLATAWTGFIIPRYAVPCVLGFAVLAALACERVASRAHVWTVCLGLAAVLALFNAWNCKETMTEMSELRSGAKQFALLTISAETLPEDALIVVPDEHLYARLNHYAGPELRRRMAHLDRGRGLVSKMSPWVPVRSVEEKTLLQEHSKFYLYAALPEPSVSGLVRQGVVLSESGKLPGQQPTRMSVYLLDASVPPK